jgi:PKD repeat protein
VGGNRDDTVTTLVVGMRRRSTGLVVFLVVVFIGGPVVVGGATAQTTAPDCSTVSYDTDGPEASGPFAVTNVSQLQCIGNASTGTALDDTFVLVSDIDASGTAEWNDGRGFDPIGAQTSQPSPNRGRFQGTLDGNNHTISGLHIDRFVRNVGLFAASTGTVENVTLERVDIRNDFVDVGGLVSFNFGRVESSSVSGRLSSNGQAGALVGTNIGTINASHARARVDGLRDVGGLVGRHAGTIDNSHATGTVTGTEHVGGLVGYTLPGQGVINASYATGDVSGNRSVGGRLGKNGNEFGPTAVTASYATGAVTGTERVGGLVGHNQNGTVTSSYATGAVTGTGRVGGLVGHNQNSTVATSYATGEVNGSENVGGLVGNGSSVQSVVTASYWDRETTGQNSSAGNGVGLTTDQMTGLSARDEMAFAFGTVWQAVPDRYPALSDVGSGAPPVNELPADRFLLNGSTFVSTPERPTAGATTTFRTTVLGTDSVESFRWEFGDGTTATGPQATHSYTTPGVYRVTHTVTTAAGTEFTRSQQVTVEAAEEFAVAAVTPHVDGVPQDDVAVLEGVEFNLSYHVSVVGPGPTETVDFQIDGEPYDGERNGSTWVFDVPPAGLDPGAQFTVTATNGTGATDTVSRPIEVIDSPDWLEAFTGTVLANQSRVEFTATVGVPPSSLDLSLTIPDRFDFPVSVPLVNQSQDPSATATLTITVDLATLSTAVTLDGSAEYNLTSRLTARGSLTGSGYFDLQEGTLTRATAGGTVGATVEYPPPPVGIPSPPVGPVPPGAVRLFPIFDIQLGATANFVPGDTAPLSFENGSLTPRLTARQELGQKYEAFEVVFGLEERLGATIPVPGITPVNGSIGAQAYVRASALGFQQRLAFPPGGDRLTYPFSLGNNTTASSRDTGWTDTDSRGWQLQQPAGDTPPKPSVPGASTTSATDVTSSGFVTDDAVTDASPALTRTEAGHLSVWSRQDSDNSPLNGRDIYLSQRTSGGFGGIEPVTDNSRREFDPALAGPTRDEQVVVFGTLNRTVDPSGVAGPAELFPNTEIALTTPTGQGTWTEPQLLTDDTTDDRHGRPTVAYSNGTWLIAWQEAADTDTPGLADRQVSYLWYNGTTSERTTVAGARAPVAAPTGNNSLQLAYLDMSGTRNAGNVTVSTFDPATQTRQDRYRYAVTRFVDVALAGGSLAWSDEATEAPAEFVSTDSDSPVAVPLDLSGTLQSLDLTASNGTTLLNARAFAPNSSVTRVSYAARVDGEWLPARPYADGSAQNLTYWQGASAPADGGFLSVFAGKDLGTDQKYDLYTFDQTFRPDLTVNATVDSKDSSLGENVTVTYTIRNTGVRATETTPVGIRTGGRVSIVDNRRGLAPDDSLTGRIDTTVDQSGTVDVVVDPQDETADQNRQNNSETVRVVEPRLSVSDVAVARANGTVAFDVTVENPLEVTGPAFDYTVDAGPDIGTEGTLSSLAPGATTTISLTAPRARVDPQSTLRVRASASSQPAGASTVLFTTPLRPQLSLEPGQVSYYAETENTVAVLSIGNAGLTGFEGVINVTNQTTGTEIAREPVQITASDGPNETSFGRIAVPLGEVPENQTVRIEVSRTASNRGTVATTVDTVETGTALVSPAATIELNQTRATVGRPVELSAVNVSSAVGTVDRFRWRLNETPTGTDQTVVFTPQTAENRTVSLVVVNGQGIPQRVETTVPVAPPPVSGAQPRDLDGDGLYEDVRGDGTVGILDTQALFDALVDGSAQEAPRAFGFSQVGPNDEVTILDVAAHWRTHVAGD